MRDARTRPSWLAGMLVLLFPVCILSGCSQEEKSVSSNQGSSSLDGGDESSELTLRRLLQEPTEGLCGSFLKQLNASRSGGEKPGADYLTFLQSNLGLTEEEREEVSRHEFTPLDSHYLEECLLFQDVLASLQIKERAPREQIAQVLQWVRRQIVLSPRYGPPVPAFDIARRGTGDLLERSYVLLSLFQQLGMPGCLIGPASAYKTQSAVRLPASQDQPPIQPTPFWAVGVLVDDNILLCDPETGRIWPHPFAAVRANPEVVKSFLSTVPALADMDVNELTGAEVYLAPSLTSLAPRMKSLEKTFSEERVISLAIDPRVLKEKYESVTEAPVKFWNPANDPMTPTRALAMFHSVAEGGLARTSEGPSFADFYEDLLAPMDGLPAVFDQLSGLPRLQMEKLYSQYFIDPVTKAGEVHDLVLRGDFGNAIRALTEMRDTAASSMNRAETVSNMKPVEKWCSQVMAVSADLSRARRGNDPAAKAQAEQRHQALFYAFVPPGQPDEVPPPREIQEARELSFEAAKVFFGAVAKHRRIRATFLLALCMHEKAHRVQQRADALGEKRAKEDAVTAWRNAADWWGQFLRQAEEFKDSLQPRIDHATQLLAEAQAHTQGA